MLLLALFGAVQDFFASRKVEAARCVFSPRCSDCRRTRRKQRCRAARLEDHSLLRVRLCVSN